MANKSSQRENKPSARTTPAAKPPKLPLPPALPPKVTLPEPPKAVEKSPVAEKGLAPRVPQTGTVTFALLEPAAKQVALCGDFNGWVSDAAPMKRRNDGVWETTLALAPGRYEYKFIVDGVWIPDPLARENIWNPHGTLNSVVEVPASRS